MRIIRASDKPLVAASHEDPKAPGVLKKVLLSRADFQAGHVQMLNWAELPVGAAFREHYHEDMQEIFVMISGRARMQTSSQTGQESEAELLRGDVAIVEPRTRHRMRNIGSERLEYIVFGITSDGGGKTIVTEV